MTTIHVTCLRCDAPTNLRAVDLCMECFTVLGPPPICNPVVCVICGDKWGNNKTTICDGCIDDLKMENNLPC